MAYKQWVESFPDPIEANRALIILRMCYNLNRENTSGRQAKDIFVKACKEELQEDVQKEQLEAMIARLTDGLIENNLLKANTDNLEKIPLCLRKYFS